MNESSITPLEIRPASLNEFIGQQHITEPLTMALLAALQRREPLGHVLFSGPPGLGKSSLAQIISTAMGTEMVGIIGPSVNNAADLAAVLCSIEPGQVLFIDEIHRVPRMCEEMLYPAMEDGKVSLIVGKGEEAHAVTIKLPPFTLVGATTRTGLITPPMRDRFKFHFTMQHYSIPELEDILERAEGVLGFGLDRQARSMLAEHSRGTPRIALKLLGWARDMAQVSGTQVLDYATTAACMELWGIQPLGLERRDVAILEALVVTFNNRPVGLSTLAAALHEEQDTISEEHEPYLLRMGLIERTPRRRQATMRAMQYLMQIGKLEDKGYSYSTAAGSIPGGHAARA